MSDLDDLARRLAAHPRWKWRPRLHTNHGTVYDDEGLVILVGSRVLVPGPGSEPAYVWTSDTAPEVLPDLTDPATAGLLLEMLTTTIGPGWRDMMCLSHADGHWTICDYADDGPEYRASTLGEAVALALLETL